MQQLFFEKLNIHKSFSKFFDNEKIKKELDYIIKAILKNDIYKKQFYPLPNDVLRFATLDLSNVKCIILGMDPYHSDYIENGEVIPISTGRSFEVKNLKSWQEKFSQASLKNILKAIYINDNYKDIEKYKKTKKIVGSDKKNILLDWSYDIKIEDIRKKILNKTFKILEPNELWDNLEKQGVMWLNATLTVEPHKPDSHTNIWKVFVDELIKYIIQYKIDNNEKEIKWMVWGCKAKEKLNNIVAEKNMIYSCHPASRFNNTFVEDNCFQYIKDVKWTGK